MSSARKYDVKVSNESDSKNSEKGNRKVILALRVMNAVISMVLGITHKQ